MDLTRLVLFDPAAGSEELVESDPLNRVDFERRHQFSERTDELIATDYLDDKHARLLEGQGLRGRLQRCLQEAAAGQGDRSSARGTKDERFFMVSAASDTEPGETLPVRSHEQEADAAVPIFDKLPRAVARADEGRSATSRPMASRFPPT